MYESSTMMDDSIQNDSLVLMLTSLGCRGETMLDNFLLREETRGKKIKIKGENGREKRKPKKGGQRWDSLAGKTVHHESLAWSAVGCC